MRIRTEDGWICEEKATIDSIDEDLKKLEKKWFKTSKIIDLIDFLKEYLKLKKRLVGELEKFIIQLKGGKGK